jgi:uncharacterized OB-fold protein
MSEKAGKILPRQNALSEPYWTGCREGELRLQQCGSCHRYQFYPRSLCAQCGHRTLTWRKVSGRGRIASFTVVRRPVSSAYPADSVIVLVDLEEGPRVMSNLVDADPESVRVGDALHADFANWSDEVVLPVFRLVTEESE